MTKGEYELLKFYEGARVEEVLIDRMTRIEHILRHALTQPMPDQEFRSEVQRAHEMADSTITQLFIHIFGDKA